MSTILIVDDDRMTRDLLADILQHEGYQVVQAEEGKQAIVAINAQPIDLLITDRAMPGMGGMELLRELARLKKGIPAVVISAFGEESLWSEAIGLGAQDYLLKPFSAKDVVKIVKKCLTRKKS